MEAEVIEQNDDDVRLLRIADLSCRHLRGGNSSLQKSSAAKSQKLTLIPNCNWRLSVEVDVITP